MTPTPLSAFLAAVGIAAACFTDAPASAQRWRVTPLVRLNFTASADTYGSIGINGSGQVVYGYKDSNNKYHAWLWLPSAAYSLSAGFNDLSTLSGSGTDDDLAIARDINETGMIVGQSESITAYAGRASVWTISGGNRQPYSTGDAEWRGESVEQCPRRQR